VEVDTHYELPASETSACKPVQKATQWVSARYDTARAVLTSALPTSLYRASSGRTSCPGFFRRPPLTYPPTPSAGRPRHRALVGHFLFSAKFICMGKQKNRLTATQPARPHTPAFGFRSRDPPRRRAQRTKPAETSAQQCTAQRTRTAAARGSYRVGRVLPPKGDLPGRPPIQNVTYPRAVPYKCSFSRHLPSLLCTSRSSPPSSPKSSRVTWFSHQNAGYPGASSAKWPATLELPPPNGRLPYSPLAQPLQGSRGITYPALTRAEAPG
jgi:hypothetical protein